MSFKSVMRKFKTLESSDFRILLAIEVGMDKHEYVPIDVVTAYSNLIREETLYRIKRMEKLRLLRRTSSPYIGYSLNYAGYDFLAVNAFTRADLITALGESLGIGKESDVYAALTAEGDRVAIKLHRLGRISFRQTRRIRSYAPRKTHWMFQSRISAEREYKALKRLHDRGVLVPHPIAQNRHAILMGNVEGGELREYKKLPRPQHILRVILENIKKAYLEAGVIHADLSEYNILVGANSEIQIIDWPQYVSPKHPNAKMLLERDVRNIINYFQRSFGVRFDLKEALNLIKRGE